jgi:purine-binding chemotaxis protein CheW
MTTETNITASAPTLDTAQIMQERARTLARPLGQEAAQNGLIGLLEFSLAKENYAVETRHVSEVLPLNDLTPLPCTPAFLCGIINVRGRILPVLDIRQFFNLPAQGITDLHRIILVQRDELELGLLADEIVGVRTLSADDLQPALPTMTGILGDYLKGVTADRLVVLDLDKLFSDEKLTLHQEVST